jgi:phage terminase large subunit-like protein
MHKGRKAYLAVDVSSTRDLTAMVAVLPPDADHEKWVIIPRFWVPEDTLGERAEQDRRVDWQAWVRATALLTTPGDSVDQAFVQEAVKDTFGHFDVHAFGFDPWNARKLAGDLQHDGMDPELQVEMRQGHQTLSGPTKELERLVFAGKVEHGGHPVLAWMFGHCSVRFDVNLNYVPDKKNSLDKIDGVIGTVMGVGLAMSVEEDTLSGYLQHLAGQAA